MRIEKEIIINDEPWKSKSTGVRKATLVYEGPRYLYLEYCRETDKLLMLTHSNEDLDLETAKETITPDTNRIIVEIDAEKAPIAAAHFWANYNFLIDDYVEKLPNGKEWTYSYMEDARLGEVYDFLNMDWDVEKGDFKEYKYLTSIPTDNEIIESIDMILEKVNDSLENNKNLSEENKKIVEKYKEELIEYRKEIDTPEIDHWKLPFPFCPVPY
jgi:hypothetical protein